MKLLHPTFLLLQLKRLRFNAARALCQHRTCRRFCEHEAAETELANYSHWIKREFQTLAQWELWTGCNLQPVEA